MFSNLFSPMPGTFIISSIVLKFPFASLYLIMLSAVFSPIPLSSCSSLLLALFIFIIFSLLSSLIIPVFSSCMISSVSSFMFGIYIFSPSSNSYAKFTFFRFAVSFVPPAASIAFAILLPSFNSYTPSLVTSPVMYIIIFSSDTSVFSLVSIKLDNSACDVFVWFK